MSYLLDTNVVSEVRKPRRSPQVAAWFRGVPSSQLYLSVLVVGEVRGGIERLLRRGDRAQAKGYERWLETLQTRFEDRLLPVSVEVAERWGALSAARTLPVIDGLLAATALVHELTLVTRDVGAIADVGVPVLNPWQR